MNGFMQIALLIFCMGVIAGAAPQNNDPCKGGGGRPGPPRPPSEPTLCRKYGGFCYDDRCKNCTDGYIRTDLCGDNEHKKCCLPGIEPLYACCEIYSDPHITTFDGLQYDVQIPGNFTVSKPCAIGGFEVIAMFEYPYTSAIWTKTVGVIVNYGTTHIVINEDGTVTVNGVLVTLPHLVLSDIYTYQSGSNIYVRIFGVDLLVCYNIHTMRLTVYVDYSWYDKLCGLCGNFNKDARDDRESIPTGLPEPRCPHPRNHPDWAQCKRELHKAMENCEGNLINRYLTSCAFDMCAGGMEDAQLTLDAANEHCTSNITDVLALPPPPENGEMPIKKK